MIDDTKLMQLWHTGEAGLDRAPLARWRQLQRAGLLPEHARRSASAGGKAESRQPQYHDRTRDQAPTTGDGKADGERESVLDLFC